MHYSVLLGENTHARVLESPNKCQTVLLDARNYAQVPYEPNNLSKCPLGSDLGVKMCDSASFWWKIHMLRY